MATLSSTTIFLLVLLPLVCLSLLPLASAGAPKRVARTRQAHEEYRRQRQLNDIEVRPGRPPLHMFETKAHHEKEEREKGAARGGAASAPIQYLGGPVMTGNPSVNVYIIYYGSWPAGSGQNVIENFIRSLSADSKRQGSPADPKVKRWWAISAAYTQEGNGAKKNVSAKCADGCGGQSTSPNGNPAIDATVSTIAHEIAEAATDPDAANGWMDADGEENADKCSYDVGTTAMSQDNRGRKYEYNLVGMNNMKFLVQQNWDKLKNRCVTQRKYQ
ncbi:unnamed protein product [Closterium sp. Naga37s-1]|nr:unnamed protein product [Closterium sp. Naga37s-1]